MGLAQCLALWPGTSRSLVTIVAALLAGLSLPAAVEYSFLLGLATLGAATGYEALTNGSTVIDTFGWTPVLLGIVVAFAAGPGRCPMDGHLPATSQLLGVRLVPHRGGRARRRTARTHAI